MEPKTAYSTMREGPDPPHSLRQAAAVTTSGHPPTDGTTPCAKPTGSGKARSPGESG